MPESAYIHIPFCKSKCKYCSFTSFLFQEKKTEYVNAMIKQIKKEYAGENLNTLYLGGGTPSLLSIEIISQIINLFKFKNNYEITIEVNPDDVEFEYLKSLYSLGINRISIGAQTFNDNILKLIGRRHCAKDTINAYKNAEKAGFKNISLDLIYGLPEQNLEILKTDLKIIKELNVPHVSTYGLKTEAPSYFFSHPPKNIPNDDVQADMYLYINKYLKDLGLFRYEISNFGKSGYESKHNLNYWNNLEYYGFGISAHGYKNGVRYSNTYKFKDYTKNPFSKNSEHTVSKQEKLEEEIFLGFRRECGINTDAINKKFGIDFDRKYSKILKKYLSDYIIQTSYGYKLSTNGILLSNIILSEFI